MNDLMLTFFVSTVASVLTGLYMTRRVRRRWRLTPVRVIVTERGDDYHACVEGESGLWGCGTTPYAALGDLLSAHQERLRCEIEWRAGP